MLNCLLGAMQHHHARIIAPLQGPLRNQFAWQIVIVIAEPRVHRVFNFIHIEAQIEGEAQVSW